MQAKPLETGRRVGQEAKDVRHRRFDLTLVGSTGFVGKNGSRNIIGDFGLHRENLGYQ